jgi:acetylornithine deacetylase/succinyl-diaminopimelate desuccinylase-like protein
MSIDEDTRQAVVAAFEADEAVKLVKQLVDIPSPEGEELECARFLHGRMQEAGIESHLQEVEEGRANVIAIVRGGGDEPTLMLNGHLDTSYTGDFWEDYPGLGIPGPNHRPQSYEIGEGIYGLGANNMKGGVAAAFMALRALKRAGVKLRGHVMASGVVGESEKAPVRGAMRDYQGRRYRGSGHGARYLITHWEPMDYVIIGEPSGLYVVNGQAGYLFVKIVVWGKSAYLTTRGHRGSGISAIEEAAEVVRALTEWGPRYTERHTFDTGMGVVEPAVTIGAIDSGWPYAPSTVPGVCHLYINLRTTPALPGKQALAELDARLRELAKERPNLKYNLEVYLFNDPSTLTSVDSPLVRAAVTVMEERLGFPTRPFARGEGNASNDTNTFRRHGIPAIKCGPNVRTETNGPEMNRFHGTHVAKGDLVQAGRFYLHMACELSGRTRAEVSKGP